MPLENGQKKYFDTKFLVEYYGVSRQSVALWRQDGMPYEQLGARTFRYNLEAVEQWHRDRASKHYKK